MERRDPLKYNWANLLMGMCPLCSGDIFKMEKGHGHAGSSLFAASRPACDFFITEERYKSVTTNLKNLKAKRFTRRK